VTGAIGFSNSIPEASLRASWQTAATFEAVNRLFPLVGEAVVGEERRDCHVFLRAWRAASVAGEREGEGEERELEKQEGG